jgi:hypothetical protein
MHSWIGSHLALIPLLTTDLEPYWDGYSACPANSACIRARMSWTRHVPNLAQVAIVNGFLGWTFVGWVVALVMAAKPVPPAAEAAGPRAEGPPRWPGS